MGEETDIAEPKSCDDAVVVQHGNANEPSKDQPRKRKKLLYKSIRELMEFYLGDVNLGKNRFMCERIQGQAFKYVDLSVFLTFNKMKSLTSSVEDVAKAISTSEILQLSEDKTQVCRKTPIGKKENEDECTIYVEQLGPDADHDVLSKVFSDYGPIDYISVPKFVSNNKNKGFAFVEFRDMESAQKAIEAFTIRGCCLSPHMAPEDLMSIRNLEPNKENQQNENEIELQDDKKDVNCDKDGTKKAKKRHKNSEGEQTCSKKIRRTSESDSSVVEIISKKKSDKQSEPNDKEKPRNKMKVDKTSEECAVEKTKYKDTIENKNISNEKPKKIKKSQEKENDSSETETLHDEDTCVLQKKGKAIAEDEMETEAPHTEDNEIEGEVEDTTDGEGDKQKKRRKKKKVKKDKSSAITMGFKVLPKREWKHLRNKYLNMQKNTMRSLKQHLSYKSKWERTRRAHVEQQEGSSEEQLVPGTVVKVTLDEPVTNVNATKGDMRVHADIKYVDVTMDNPCVYLRTSTPEVANSLVQAKHWTNMEIIQGNEEAEYWNKMRMDREQYFNKSKINMRGRTKLLKRADRFQGKHII